MKPEGLSSPFAKGSLSELIALAARLILGGLFIFMGLSKAMYPVDFLKILRQYDLMETSFLLNFVAATLPWFEVFCGLLIVLGIGVRGSTLLLFLLLIPFTLTVLNRAWAIHARNAIPLCAVRLDCGCGAGEVAVCRKLAENGLLILVSLVLLRSQDARWCVRHSLVVERKA